MSTHLERDLARVKSLVLQMGALAEDALACARLTYKSRNPADLDPLRKFEQTIDQLQVEIDDEIIKILALHQPVAGDLRYLLAALKIVNDLERIGDLTDSMANRLERLSDLGGSTQIPAIDLEYMMGQAANILTDSLHSFVRLDSEMARSVLTRDDEIDALNAQHFETLVAHMKHDPQSIDACVALLSMSRCAERIADLATNIAEDVVFVVEAEDIRHTQPSSD